MMFVVPPDSKILFIDDDKVLLKNIREYFEDSGFTVLEAEDVQAGIDIFKEKMPDAVVTDLQLKDASGLEVLKVLTTEFPGTPVVVISEPSGLKDVIQALRMGAWDYLTKPIPQLPVLEQAVCRALERSRLIEENRVYRIRLEEANQALKKSLDILEQDQEAGRSVQMKLLPEQDITFGYYHLNHNIAPSLYLSGDFVDYFKINDQNFCFYIADVSGHGSSSAFVTVLLKSTMSQILARYQTGQDTVILEPDKVMSLLSQEIYVAKLGKYLTMINAVFNLTTNALTYSIGGHYPNPILLENGKAQFLEGQGFPLGIMKETKYTPKTIQFNPKMTLMMFSDGIAELLPEKEMEKKEKLLLKWVEEGNGSIKFLLERLNLLNTTDTKNNLPDDVTIFAMNPNL